MSKILSISVALILLAGQLFLSIGRHYCSGEVVETKLLWTHTRLGCEMTDMNMSCSSHTGIDEPTKQFENIPCCENRYQNLLLPYKFVKSSSQINLNPEIVTAFVSTFTHINFSAVSVYPPIIHTPTPPPEVNLQALLQTYRT